MASDLNEILQTAEKLGQLVAQHPAIEKYRQAQKSLTEDSDATRLLGEFDRQLETLARQEAGGAPISDAQRRALETLQTQIAAHLKIKALNIAQVEFTDLHRRVSQTWQRPLAEAAGGGAVRPAQPAGPRLA